MQADEYDDTYAVCALRVDVDLSASWRGLVTPEMQVLGRVAVASVRLVPSRRSEIDIDSGGLTEVIESWRSECTPAGHGAK